MKPEKFVAHINVYKLVIYLMVLAILVAILWVEALQTILIYQRAHIASGELWRMFTGHLVHQTPYHLITNVLALVAIHIWSEDRPHNKELLAILCSISFLSSLQLYVLFEKVAYYFGLSGLIHGYFIYLLLSSKPKNRLIHYSLIIGVMLKVVWEMSPLYDPMAKHGLIGDRVAVEAHLSGVIAGIFIFGFRQLRKQLRVCA